MERARHTVTYKWGTPGGESRIVIICLSVCRCSQTACRNSCSIVSGDVYNCSYCLTVIIIIIILFIERHIQQAVRGALQHSIAALSVIINIQVNYEDNENINK